MLYIMAVSLSITPILKEKNGRHWSAKTLTDNVTASVKKGLYFKEISIQLMQRVNFFEDEHNYK